MHEELQRAPVLAQDASALTPHFERNVRRLAAKLAPHAEAVERRWRRKLDGIVSAPLTEPCWRALASLTPGAWTPLLQQGRLEDFFENVEYHARKLAKLDVPPQEALDAIAAYSRIAETALRRARTPRPETLRAAFDHLYLCIKLSLHDAYYQVRDNEAAALYDVLQDQLETSEVRDLLARTLDTLVRTFRAGGGVILTAEHCLGRLETRCAQGAAAAGWDFPELAGRAMDSGEPQFAAAGGGPEPRSAWAAPLAMRGKPAGVIGLVFEHEYHCLPRERKLFQAMAERCALAIEKAQLLEDLRDREERIRALGEHMLNVEEQERRRISRELHDEVGQALLAVRLSLEMIQEQLPKEAAGAARKLEETRKVVEATIVDMRRLISALSPSVLEQLGLTASIRQFVKNLGRTFAGNLEVEMAGLDQLPETSRIMIYRLVQECFANAVRHSRASRVRLDLRRQDGRVRMRLDDDGVGFDLAQAAAKKDSFGLAGIRERVVLLGGAIDIRTAPGAGTKVAIEVPV